MGLRGTHLIFFLAKYDVLQYSKKQFYYYITTGSRPQDRKDGKIVELLEQARALEGELRAFKDELHRHPELSFQEVHTTALLKEKLAGWGWN